MTNLFSIIFLFIAVLFAAVVTVLPVILGVNRFYCYIFERRLYEGWKYFIERINDFDYYYESDLCYEWRLRGTNITANVWKDSKLCSIHFDNRDCLCTFDTYHSKIMTKLLMSKLTKNDGKI